MVSSRSIGVFATIFGMGLGLATLALPGGAAVAADKGPPSCAKIFFRPLPPGQNDGEQEAGIYTSRFSHIELKASVKSGEPQDYYLTAHNKKLNPLSGSVPAAVVNCAKEKKLPAPGKAAASCTGDRFAALITHAGKDKVALLYALHGREWEFCSAGTLPGEG
ncbi:MAG: hypothetical protein JWL84_4537 [Rhodospirillales bacterium]|nr:hypothetical protein [Rhodospirillales bacterium]